MGIGVLFSSISVLIFQGGLTLCVLTMQSVFTEIMINELTAVGGIILLELGITLHKKNKDFKYAPSLVIVVILTYALEYF